MHDRRGVHLDWKSHISLDLIHYLHCRLPFIMEALLFSVLCNLSLKFFVNDFRWQLYLTVKQLQASTVAHARRQPVSCVHHNVCCPVLNRL